MYNTSGMNFNQGFGIRCEVQAVNGKEGAMQYSTRLAQGSSTIVLDNTADDLIWLIQSNGDVRAFTIAPYVPPQEPTMADLLAKISALEAKLNESNPATHESTATA